MLNQVTIIVKTFMRPQCIERFVNSVREFYPTVTILIADDSYDDERVTYSPENDPNTQVYSLPFNTGLSHGRNFLLDRVNTPFMMLCDDDFIFTEETDLDTALSVLASLKFDILSGQFFDRRLHETTVKRQPRVYHGIMQRRDHTLYVHTNTALHINNVFTPRSTQLTVVDFCLNFFVARTDSLRKIRWNEELKLLEHLEFFFRAKNILKISVWSGWSVDHDPTTESPPDYMQIRNTTYENLDSPDSHHQKLLRALGVSRIVRDGRQDIG